ncbi:MAG: hypothetical protein J0I71_00110 [Rhodanobacter sp.]|jgi:hypothetical protein|uniref:hypothetical protein n=1 Tax=Rhodanobacter sp. FW021-MT20 TaxID=1162282 RepID=UPI000260FC63|nr:hypothetical protein [Rhodanobacter sp. 115]EIL99586.1 hypothetical protein UU5_02777 [Rhodanobacter sp. 115]MBN8893227.1 hypothetical protein [Rhodanobacter sp.]OJW29970.1 MAG: hypothetical protein BGO50_08965 [Rhodanobacter sp. 67-28]
MTSSPRVLAGKLLRALGSAASYNDKGFVWSGHDETRQVAFRSQLQANIAALTEQIGQDALGPELFNALMSGIAAEDASGKFVLLARTRLGAENGL